MPGPVESVRVDRSWLGAPAGTLGNPTVWLLALAVALLALGTLGYLSGALPAWATVAIHAVALYVAFTPLHESMHGIAHEVRWANAAIGRLTGTALTLTLPLFRSVHFEHHSHTNDPARDPDFIVSRRPRWLLPVWCLAVPLDYRVKFYGHRLWRTRAQLAEVLVMDAAIAGALGVAVAGGFGTTLAVVWFAPAALAVLLLAFSLDFLPHYPYDTRARYFDTRVYPGALLNAVLLGQNYHLIHHLWTTIPWYRYRRVFAATEGDLARRGCRLGWRVASLPPGVPREA